MNIFILFGSLLWLGILALLFLCLIALLITAGAKRSKKLAFWSIGGTLGAMLAVTAVFIGLGYLWLRPYDPTSVTDLKEAYKADFGTLPPPGITVLKARQVVISDSGGQWLLLKATPEEIDKHIAMGFKKTESAPPDFRGEAGANAPKWWTPPAAGLELYSNTNWSKAGGWYRSEAVMGVDRTSKTIWFSASKSS
jgi:hypothetical protein